MVRRGMVLLALFFICIALLIGRLYYIQIYCGPVLTAAAKAQQQIPVIYPYSRGVIYDRNMEKLTNTTYEYYYILAKEHCTPSFETLIGHIGGTRTGNKGDTYVVYHVNRFQAAINALLQQKYQAYGLCASSRYADHQVAEHLIGYVNQIDGTGACGLEKLYEQQLGGDGPKLYLQGNGMGDVISGIGLDVRTMQQNMPASLVTTIDAGLQREVEKRLEEERVSGAVIVADVQTGQILTMASSPGYNPNALEKYLNNDSSELVNKAVQCQYAVGPLLDVVKKAADLGEVSLMEAAVSLGFGQCVWENYPDEASGYLPDINHDADKQRDADAAADLRKSMEATPIQVCQMVVTLGNLGEKIPLSMVKSHAQEESIFCFHLTNEKNLIDKPIMGKGWAAGICQNYAVIVYAEDAPRKARKIYGEVEVLLKD